MAAASPSTPASPPSPPRKTSAIRWPSVAPWSGKVEADQVEFADGVFTCTANEERMTIADAASRMMRTGGPLTASASATSTGVGPIFAGNIIDVEVDPETGKVDILRCTAFIDSGTSVHPSYVEGQMQGGTMQGIGWALSEDYTYGPDGQMLNSTFLDYRMPTALDMPHDRHGGH